MNFRVVNEARMNQVSDLWDYCFEKKDEPFFQYYFDQYCGKNNMVIGGFEEIDNWEYLRCMLHVNPYMLKLRQKNQFIPYIVGVATAPEARGQHLFRPLLETTFDVLRAQNVSFVTLKPINAGIYLPYEFSWCYFDHSYELPADKLTLPPAPMLPCQRHELKAELLAPIYESVTASWNGVPIRTDFQWQKLLTVCGMENTQCVVVYEDNQASGYMLYQLQNGCFNIFELLAKTAAAKNRLLHYAAQHKSEAPTIKWLAPEWDTTYLNFKDQAFSGSYEPFMMARCLNARQALVETAVPEDMPQDTLVLLLTDSVIKYNNHLLKLKTAPGKMEVVTTADEEEITMNMAAFTQMYFGAYTATELFEAGLIRCKNTTKLALLDTLFPKTKNWINEYF